MVHQLDKIVLKVLLSLYVVVLWYSLILRRILRTISLPLCL